MYRSTLLAGLLLCPTFCLAQDATPTPTSNVSTALQFEGVGNDVDKDNRNPLLTLEVKRGAGVVSLLADAVVRNSEFENSPIQFDFFVNRKLFSSQIRSKALNGPVGAEVRTEDAAMPFNYSVLAKVIHPNRQFSTLIEGAVFPYDFNSTLDCALTVSVDENSSKIYSQDAVKMVQGEGETFAVELLGLATSSGASTASVTGSVKVKISDSTATSTITLTQAEATPKDIELSGTVTLVDGVLNAFSLSSADAETVLECE